MIGWFVWGAMNLAWTIEYAVQAGWSSAAPFIGLLSLAGLGATESGVDHRVIGIVAIISTLMYVASGLAVVVSGFRSARFACIVIATGQPTILSCTKTGHECHEGCH